MKLGRLQKQEIRTYWKNEGSDFTNRSDWPNQHAWFKDNLEKFTKFFRPLVRKV